MDCKESDIQKINLTEKYEQLRHSDSDYTQLQANAISAIAKALLISCDDVINIEVLKKGMTNRSFIFVSKGKKYIMRIPGEGTEQLIDREKEANVYHQIRGKRISDEVLYINPKSGYKITSYWENARVCDPYNESDLRKCMTTLRYFHSLELKVDHKFDIFEQIEFYESLWQGVGSTFRDYKETKKHVMSLRPFIESHKLPYVLTHIDAIPDNFLFIPESDKQEEVRLIDWEYAGMQDPHVDIAMFCIYSMYNREWVDILIDLYFDNICCWENRVKIYCYIACCGLLWSNWCEYKKQLGVEFGEYSIRQYQYAKEYYRIVQEEFKQRGDSNRCIE